MNNPLEKQPMPMWSAQKEHLRARLMEISKVFVIVGREFGPEWLFPKREERKKP